MRNSGSAPLLCGQRFEWDMWIRLLVRFVFTRGHYRAVKGTWRGSIERTSHSTDRPARTRVFLLDSPDRCEARGANW